MTEEFYPVEFTHEGVHYKGRVSPEKKESDAHPASYHVVLNDVFFGYVHKHDDHWHVSEQRPASLVQKVGEVIENVYPGAG